MKQLALGISPPPQPTLDNFVSGANAELLARLRELRSGNFPECIQHINGAENYCKPSYSCHPGAGLKYSIDEQELPDKSVR